MKRHRLEEVVVVLRSFAFPVMSEVQSVGVVGACLVFGILCGALSLYNLYLYLNHHFCCGSQKFLLFSNHFFPFCFLLPFKPQETNFTILFSFFFFFFLHFEWKLKC